MDKQPVSLEDIVMVPTKCENCGDMGQAPTFRQYLENEDHLIVKMLDKNNYVDILCGECAEQVTPDEDSKSE